MTIFLFVLGLVLLVLGAELLVRGASRLAASMGISPLVIGLTVVAFGTSAPELSVSVAAAWHGQADLALGNVVGSNIFNVLFILGVSGIITPLLVAQALVRRDVPIMIAVSILVFLLARDGRIGRYDGLLLFSGLVAYTAWCVLASRAESRRAAAAAPDEVKPEPVHRWPSSVALVIVGLLALVQGSRWLVHGAVTFAELLGVSEVIVGLTIVAAGTSLPEVATSIMAAIRGERDIAVGNVVGSNVFNILGVLGVSAAVAPAGLSVSEGVRAFDMPVMLAVAVACLPLFATGFLLARWEAALFLVYYIAYTTYLILQATQHEALGEFKTVMGFVLPITAVTILVVSWRAWRARQVPRAAGPG